MLASSQTQRFRYPDASHSRASTHSVNSRCWAGKPASPTASAAGWSFVALCGWSAKSHQAGALLPRVHASGSRTLDPCLHGCVCSREMERSLGTVVYFSKSQDVEANPAFRVRLPAHQRPRGGRRRRDGNVGADRGLRARLQQKDAQVKVFIKNLYLGALSTEDLFISLFVASVARPCALQSLGPRLTWCYEWPRPPECRPLNALRSQA